MNFISNPHIKLGILGGGQLGKMMLLSTANYDVYTKVLDPDPHCSSAPFCSEFVQGSFNDYQTVIDFGKDCQYLTVEIEHVNTDALHTLKSMGVEVHPDPAVLEVIKDKGRQKEFYREKGIKTSDFQWVEGPEEIVRLVKEGSLVFPFVQKTRTAGYDGKGVKMVRNEEDLHHLLAGPSVVEVAVPIKKELAVIVAQSDATPGIVAFDVVDMEFNPQANLVEFLYSPANVSQHIKDQAVSLAKSVLQGFNNRGLLAVELFLDEQDELWVNEVAPRPHNSGHHTIDANVTSQFEQHWRSVLNLPLGDVTQHSPAVMVNLLGEPGYEGPVTYEGWSDAMNHKGVKMHVYGKKTTKPFRKMGHFTVISDTLDEAISIARNVKNKLKVVS